MSIGARGEHIQQSGTENDDETVLDTMVGTGTGHIQAREWRWRPAGAETWIPDVSAKLVAVFVSLNEPRVVAAYSWDTSSPGAPPELLCEPSSSVAPGTPGERRDGSSG